MHPFRFGVQLSHAPSGERWAELARRAESLGYDIVVMPDHLGRQLAPIAALAAAATATTRLRIGSFVFANDYRHPLVLAREAATLDVVSGGRFELGLGAGWMTRDYRQLGIPYDPPPRRVDRLFEAVPLVKRLLAGETVTHAGPSYRLDRARLWPDPVQRPRPPLALGGGGPRLLRFAAREADIVGFIPQVNARGRPILGQVTEAALAHKVAIVREAAGERFEHLELNVWLGDAGLVGSGNGRMASVAAAAKSVAAGLVGTPYALYGTLRATRESLLRRRAALGISYYVIPGEAMLALGPLVESLAGR